MSPVGLADRIETVRKASLTSLDEAHDFFVHTKAVWRLAQMELRRHKRFTLKNRVTQSAITEKDLPELSQKYVTQQMSRACLQQLISGFEEFIFNFLAEYHVEYPRSLAAKQLTLETVLDYSSTDQVIREVINRHVRDVAYQRIDEWFKAVERIAKIGTPDEDTIGRLKEAKASRDVAIHNQGVVGSDYVARCGDRARFRTGDRLEIPEAYLRELHTLIRKTIDQIAETAIDKLRT